MDGDFDASVYERVLARERAARSEAERLLEEKSLALYEANRCLEESLSQQRREAFYHKVLLDSVTDGILTVGADGYVQTANPSSCRIFGYEHDQIIGRPCSDLLKLEATSKLPTFSNHFFADDCTEKEPTLNAIGRASDGEPLSLELSASYGQIDGDVLITWVIRDVGFIDALKRQSNLSQRLEGIGELAAGIAHEINTPIQFVFENSKFVAEAYGAISGVLDVYEAAFEKDEELRTAIDQACPSEQLSFYRAEITDAIEEMKAGAWRIGEIVAAIKEFSHPGTEALAPVNLNDLVKSAVTVTANNCKYVAEVECDLDDSIPTVRCYRGQIAQVMVNLIVNAADAIAEKSGGTSDRSGKISIRTGAKEGAFFFAVSDTGVGIEPQQIDNVFLPFYTTKEVGKGTGQGLAITHTIVVENHGGRIHIDSEPGVGSTFVVALPR